MATFELYDFVRLSTSTTRLLHRRIRYSTQVGKRYTTLILDAFDTLVHIDWSRIPTENIDGQPVLTTARAVYPVYVERLGNIDFATFYRAQRASYEEAERRRAAGFREVTSQDRFRIMAEMLGQAPQGLETEFFDRLAAAHMDRLFLAMEIRPENIETLAWARQRFRCGMISNFDYAPAIYRLLDRYRIRESFECVAVSAEVGWRKPHRRIFEYAFDAMRIHPSEALFVGDHLDLDLRGASEVGMDCAWIDSGKQQWSASYPEPAFRITALPELVSLLK